MPWQLLIAFSILANLTFILLQRRYSQRSRLPYYLPPAIYFVLGVWPCGIALGLLTPHQVEWSPWLVFLLIGGSLAVNASAVLAFKAVSQMRVIRFETILKLKTITAILLGSLLLHETLTPVQALGGILLLTGALIAVRAPRIQEGPAKEDGSIATVMLAVASAVLMGVGLVAEKAALGHMDIGAYVIFGYGTTTLSLLLAAAIRADRKTWQLITKSDLKTLFVMGLALGASGVMYVSGLAQADNISLVSTITTITSPLAVLASYLILRERDNPRLLYLSLAISFAGLLIIGLA